MAARLLQPGTYDDRTGGSTGDGAQRTRRDLPVASPGSAPAAQAQSDAIVATAARVRVITDVLDVVIDTQGGDLRQADLTRFPKDSKAPDVPVRLLNDQMPELFIIQSGLRTQTGTEPTHHVVFNSEQTRISTHRRPRACWKYRWSGAARKV